MVKPIVAKLTLDPKGFIRGIEGAGDAAKGAGKKTKGLGDSILKTAAGFITAQAAIAIFKTVVRELTQQITSSVKAFAAFESGIAKVNTLLIGQGGDAIQSIQKELLLLDSALGTTQQTTEATYQAISAGVEPARAVAFVGQAALLAKAGFTDLTTAVDATTTVINAYGLTLDDAQRISDVFITTQNLGKTTVAEFGAVIGSVLPLANQAGVNIEQMGAAIATLTASGIDTNRTMTGLRAIFASLIKITPEAQKEAARLGIEFNLAALEAKGLDVFLREVTEATDGNVESLAKLFPNLEAIVPVLALGGAQADKFSENLADMTEAGGATASAYAIINATLTEQFTALTTDVEKLRIEIVTEFGPALLGAVDDVQDLIDIMREWVEITNETIEAGGDFNDVLINLASAADDSGEAFRVSLEALSSIIDVIKPVAVGVAVLMGEVKILGLGFAAAFETMRSIVVGFGLTIAIAFKGIQAIFLTFVNAFEDMVGGLLRIAGKLPDIFGGPEFRRAARDMQQRSNASQAALGELDREIRQLTKDMGDLAVSTGEKLEKRLDGLMDAALAGVRVNERFVEIQADLENALRKGSEAADLQATALRNLAEAAIDAGDGLTLAPPGDLRLEGGAPAAAPPDRGAIRSFDEETRQIRMAAEEAGRVRLAAQRELFQKEKGQRLESLRDRLKTEEQLLTERRDVEIMLIKDAQAAGEVGAVEGFDLRLDAEQRFLDEKKKLDEAAFTEEQSNRLDILRGRITAEEQMLQAQRDNDLALVQAAREEGEIGMFEGFALRLEAEQRFLDGKTELLKAQAEIEDEQRIAKFEKENQFQADLLEAFGINLRDQNALAEANFATLREFGVQAFLDIESAVSDTIFAATQGALDINKVWAALSKSLVKGVLDALVRIAFQSILSSAIGVSSAQKQASANIGGAVGSTFANTMASISAIPIIGPIIAPKIAAKNAVLANVGALIGIATGSATGKLVGSFQTGVDFIERSGLASVHRGERVLSSETNADLTSFLRRSEEERRESSPTFNLTVMGDFIGEDEFVDRLAEKITESREFRGIEEA